MHIRALVAEAWLGITLNVYSRREIGKVFPKVREKDKWTNEFR
jgi:hypothetical protein